jgi:hypothetical protein
MKKLLVSLMLVFVVVAGLATTTYAQGFERLESENMVLNEILYNRYFLQRTDTLITEGLELQDKFERRLLVGAGITTVGIAGIVYTLNMPTPVYQINNPALNEQADIDKRNRRIVGGISALVTTVGGIIFVDAFKFDQRAEVKFGLAKVGLTFRLTGEHPFNGRASKKTKSYIRYRKRMQ